MEYYAFISYKREDEKWAKWLQNKLEHYRFPTNLNGRTDLPKNIRPTFRDVTDLKPGLLAEEINNALCNSEWLIVICSPRSAKSPWVCKEAQTFIDLGRADHIIPFVIEGNPISNDREKECYPEALLNLTGSKELLAANISEMGCDAAAIKVVSRMFNIRFDTLWQRHEREKHRRHMWIIVELSVFMLAVIGIAAYIWQQNIILRSSISRAAANKSIQLLEQGDGYYACRLALAALSFSQTSDAESAFRQSLIQKSAILTGHLSWITSATFSPDGKYIVSTSRDRTIRIWDALSGKCLRILDGAEDYYVTNAEFSPDGKNIVSAGADEIMRIWDVNSGKCLKEQFGHSINFHSVSYSPDGKNIVSAGGQEHDLKVWDSRSGECQIELPEQSFGFYSAAYSADGKRIVTVTTDNNLKILDAQNCSCIQTIKGHFCEVTTASLSPDGNLMADVDNDIQAIRIWNIQSGKCIQVMKGHSGDVNSAAFSPDGTKVVSASCDSTVRIWDVQNGKCLQILRGHTDKVNTAVLSPDGISIVSASNDETIRIWDINHLKCLKKVIKAETVINSINYCQNGKNIVSSGYGNTIHIWNEQSGKCINMLHGHKKNVKVVSVSPNEKYIASASEDSTLRIWDAQNGSCLQTIKTESPIDLVVFSPDNRNIASVSHNTIKIWNAQKGTCLKTIEGVFYGIRSVEFSPYGRLMVSVSGDGIMRIWNTISGECLQIIECPNCFNSIDFSPDGKYIVLACYDKNIYIWDMKKNEFTQTLIGHTQEVSSVSFSPSGKYIVSISKDNSIKVWDKKSGMCLQSFIGKDYLNGFDFWHAGASFSPDETRIISASYSGEIYIFDFSPLQELIDEARERFKNNPLTPEERRQYYFE